MNKLFEPCRIGSMELKNRVIMSPMGTASDTDGGFTKTSHYYYVRRAQGGFGLITLPCNIATDKYETRPNNMLDNFHKVGRLNALVDECHQYGAKVCMQISPGCGRMGYSDPNTPPYAASAVPSCWFPDLICRPFSVEQIHDLVEKVGYSAMLAKTAGCDAVQFQGYGGYLIDQFMTSLWNKRDDEYGGSLENRMRFPLELIAEVRKTCGKDYPILFKFTAVHEIEGGRTIDEGIEIAKLLEAAGVAALQVDYGCHECYYNPISSEYGIEGNKLDICAEIRRHVSIPTYCDGKLGSPAFAEMALRSGKTDFIALAKQSLAEPDWPNKVRAGMADRVRRCMYCCECHKGMHSGKNLMCAVNPLCSYEREFPLKKAQEPKKLLVIGGGPGGMACAIAAAECGHKVTLWERELHLGGAFLAASAPSFKADSAAYLRYLTGELSHSGVRVVMEKEATVENVAAFGADAVVLAVGSVQLRPRRIAGIDKDMVRMAQEVILGYSPVGDRVSVIGGGLVGCECALKLAMEGKKVDLIEMMDRISPTEEMNPNNMQLLKKKLNESGVNIRLRTSLEEIRDASITISHEGTVTELPCDNVVLALGRRPDRSFEDALKERIDNVFVIGDAARPGKVYNAVHDAYHTARLLEELC